MKKKETNEHRVKQMRPVQTIVIGYSLLILLGALLLCLPVSTRAVGAAPFSDALFTATSATCVTGLVVQDTYTYWSTFGQCVILTLIQVGGLGFVSFAILSASFTRRRISLRSRLLMQESINAPQLSGIVHITWFICIGTFAVELLGAGLLAIRFIPEFGWQTGLYLSVFHSVSAFCNAGFDLMGIRSPGTSLSLYSGDPLVILTVSGLVILGGLGFFVWRDVAKHGLRPRRYCLHTKIVLATTGFLLLGGTLLFFLLELGGDVFAGKGIGEIALISFFQSVSPRTAGMASVDLTRLRDATILLITILMCIGGSPGSTAGGFKTTTFAVVVLCVVAELQRKASPEAFGRRIPAATVRKAICLVMLCITVLCIGTSALSLLDGASIRDALFEVASAIGTTGLSLNLTSTLGPASRLVLIVTMFCGRVGSLTILYVFTGHYEPLPSKKPEENITIG